METDKNIGRVREKMIYENGHRHGYAAGKVAAREEMLVVFVIGLIICAFFSMLF